MSLIQKITGAPQQAAPTTSTPSNLTREELEFLLRVLGNTDIKGREVEMFYNLVIKLQNTYVLQKP